jgi:chromatin remodeling complex protein RSC6
MANKKISKPVSDATASKVSEPISKEKKTNSVSESTPVKKTSKKEEVVVEEEVVDETSETSEKKKRVVPTRESVVSSFDEVIQMVETEIASLRDSSTKAKGVKFLRTLNKRLKTLKTQVSRIKQRSSTKMVSSTNTNTNSGFLKPVKISSDMAKFTGWNPDELKSRVDVTKFLCNYIRENNLQNPTDKRQIVPDAKLSKLIKYDSKKESEPLRYYSLQKFLKPHFMKVVTA